MVDHVLFVLFHRSLAWNRVRSVELSNPPMNTNSIRSRVDGFAATDKRRTDFIPKESNGTGGLSADAVVRSEREMKILLVIQSKCNELVVRCHRIMRCDIFGERTKARAMTRDQQYLE